MIKEPVKHDGNYTQNLRERFSVRMFSVLLRDQHLLKFDSLIQKCDYLEDAKDALENNKIACIGMCSIDMSSYSCAERIEKETVGQIRGKRVHEEPITFDRCIVCGAPNPVTVYVAQSY